MVFLNMFYQVPRCDESKYYCELRDSTTMISICQILASIAVPIVIWKHREVGGFSINFQFLYAVAFAFKYLDDRAVEDVEISELLDETFRLQQMTKRFLLIMMIVTLVITVCYAKHDKFDIRWNTGGIVVSLIFALDHFSLDFTARDRWMIGSYMDIIAWITQFKLLRKRKHCIIDFYIVFMFFDLAFKMVYSSYDSYRDQLYGNVGFKFDLLKILLFCCFIIQWIIDNTKITKLLNHEVTKANVMTEVSSGSSEPPVRDSTEKCPKNLVYRIDNEKNISNKSKLMSPN